MRLTVQRVLYARVEVDNNLVGSIDDGLLVFVGYTDGDTPEKNDEAIKKIINMRIFADQEGKLNLSLLDIKGSILVISQFTLYANCSRGRRPDFTHAAPPELARALYNDILNKLTSSGITTQSGIFATDMKVSLLNDGPITINLEY